MSTIEIDKVNILFRYVYLSSREVFDNLRDNNAQYRKGKLSQTGKSDMLVMPKAHKSSIV